MEQDQLIQLLINNLKPAVEIEAIYKRCCIFYGVVQAMGKCQEIISFAKDTNIDLLESFRFHVEVELLTAIPSK